MREVLHPRKINQVVSMATLPPPVDVNSNPYLTGCFEAVTNEGVWPNLTATTGELPADIVGTYIRNGPNPRFTPIGSYVYPVDGDGMVHAITLSDGVAVYRNKFVRTPMLKREEEVGHALWGGIMSGVVPGEEEAGPALANQWKDLPDINVVRHHGKLIALAEMSRSYSLGDKLETLDPVTYGGVFAQGTCAHPKVDPVTGEMIVFTYGLEAPFLTWAVIGADGQVTSGPHAVDTPKSCMIHDFAITATSIVLVVNPLIFDLEAAMSGGSLLSWKPELGCRIAVISRKTGAVTWHQGDAFWTWHFANAHDVDGGLVVDAVVWDRPGFGEHDDHTPSKGTFSRLTLPRTSDAINHQILVDRPMEFPRIDDRLIGQVHHQVAVGARTGREVPPGEFDAVLTINPESGSVTAFDAGTLSVGEPCFVPSSDGSTGGYYVTYATDRTTMRSSFVVLAADDVAAGPVATIELPVRVPLGLHGAWLPI